MPSSFRIALILSSCLLVLNSLPSRARADIVRGQIKSDSGSPVANATVTVERASRSGKSSFRVSTVTDDDGRFRIDDAPQGMYNVVVRKKGWTDADSIVMSTTDANTKDDVIVMQLTPLYTLLTHLQFGSTIYVVAFGLVVLAFNYYWAPEPSSGVRIFGWTVVAVGIAISCYKLGWRTGVGVTALGVAAGYAIQRTGHKVASVRLREESKEQRAHDEIEQLLRDEIASLVGKEAVTVTDLKACGTVLIEGKVIEARALRGFIAQDVRVVVTSLEGRRPVVETCESHNVSC